MNQQPLNPIFLSQRSKPQRNTAVRLGTGCLFVLGGFVLLGSIIQLAEAGGDGVGGAFGALLFGLAMTGAAYAWLRWMRKRENQRILQYQEKLVLDVAAMSGGVVTLAMISQSTPLSVSEVEETLRRLAMQGLARTELLDDGGIVYRFIGLGPFRFDDE